MSYANESLSGIWLISSKLATQYSTIEDAMAISVSGDTITLGTGVYAENVIIKAGVCLKGTSYNVIITGLLATGTRVTLNDGSLLENVIIKMPTDATSGVLYNGTTISSMNNVKFDGNGSSGTGILITGTGKLVLDTTYYNSGICDKFIDVNGTGDLHAVNTHILDGSGNVLLHVRGGGSVNVSIFDSHNPSTFIDGLLVDDGTVAGTSIQLVGDTNSIRISHNSAKIELNAVLLDSTTFDILIDPALTVPTLHMTAAQLNMGKVSIPQAIYDNDGILMTLQDDNALDPSLKVIGELHVGTDKRGFESVFGEGDSHTIGMTVLTNTNFEIGSWTDITSLLNVPDGSSAMFNSVNVGESFYVGSDKINHGIRVNVSTVLNLGSGSLVYEYWDGATWVEFNHMSTSSSTPYTQHGDSAFLRIDTEQIRIGDVTGWTTKLLNGFTKYWLRIRVDTSITTVPIFNSIKIHTNRTEINADGFIELFGNARSIKSLNWHRKLFDGITGSSPANEPIEITSTLTLSAIDNQYSNGAIDSSGGLILLPFGLDTSFPVELLLIWFPFNTASGNIEWEIESAIVRDGDIFDGSSISSVSDSQIIASPEVAQLSVRTTFSIDVSTALPDDMLALRFVRDATPGNPDDTYQAAVAIVSTQLNGTFWR